MLHDITRLAELAAKIYGIPTNGTRSPDLRDPDEQASQTKPFRSMLRVLQNKRQRTGRRVHVSGSKSRRGATLEKQEAAEWFKEQPLRDAWQESQNKEAMAIMESAAEDSALHSRQMLAASLLIMATACTPGCSPLVASVTCMSGGGAVLSSLMAPTAFSELATSFRRKRCASEQAAEPQDDNEDLDVLERVVSPPPSEERPVDDPREESGVPSPGSVPHQPALTRRPLRTTNAVAPRRTSLAAFARPRAGSARSPSRQ